MKLRIIFIVSVFTWACKAKDPSLDLEENLKNAMQTYLYSSINNDSSNVKYRIENIIYYDDKRKDEYICEFTVHLKAKLFDTTGTMKAYISKDFKKVERLY